MRHALYPAVSLAWAATGLAWANVAAAADTETPSGKIPESAAAYQSVISGYRPYREDAIAGWRGVNDEMGRLRGHMGHIHGVPSDEDASGMQEQHGSTGGRQ